MADTQTAPAFKPAAPEQVAQLTKRSARPSPYLENVKAIVGKGPHTLEVAAEDRVKTVGQLYKAGEQAGVKVKAQAPKDQPTVIVVTVTQKDAAKK